MLLFAQLLANGVYTGSLYALYGLSFAIIFTTTKTWHFAQGAVFTLAAYAILGVQVLSPAPLGVAVAAASGVAALAGLGCFEALYQPLARRGATPLVVVLGSLGAMGIVQNLLALWFGPSGYSLPGDMAPPVVWSGVILSSAQLAAPAVAAVTVLLVHLLLSRTGLGRHIRALTADDELLALQGIGTIRLKRIAFAGGSALLALPAGLLLMSGAGVSPYIGIEAVLTGAMALFLGGVDSVIGAAIGGFVIGLVENLAAYAVPTEWQTAVTYTLLLAFLLARPTGLLGRALPQSTI